MRIQKCQRAQKRMFKKLNTKFILLFTSVLVCVFGILIAVVQLCSTFFMDNYIQNTIFSLQSNIDEAITGIVDETAYFYARIAKRENAALFDALGNGATPAARSQAFGDIVRNAGMNEYYFIDAGWKDNHGYYSLNGYPAPSDELYAEAEKNKNALIFGGYKNGCELFMIYMKNDFTRTEGVFVFYLLENTLSEAYELLVRQAGYSYIISPDGYVVSHEDKNYLGKILFYRNLYTLESTGSYQVANIDGVKQIVTVSPVSTVNERYNFDWHLVSVMDFDYYYGSFSRLTVILIIAAASILIIGITLAVLRAKRITQPVERLNKSINEIITTGKKFGKIADRRDELYQLEKKYDEMIQRIFNLMKENQDKMEIQRKLELEAMQMQINPHFLYNTLDTVVWMAKLKNEPEIESLVVNLAKFFRLSLHKGDKFILVSEELKIIEHYLEIEKIRFPDKVQIFFSIDQDIKKYKTLKLILQPIVENALKHAFQNNKGNLYIRAYGQEDDIIFEVEDDGVGFEVKDDILKISSKRASGGGYGLYNVNGRIKLEYGENYGLNIYSKPDEGTKIIIRIPKRI